MIRKSLFIFGPGGIGKSPLDDIIARKVVRIVPYRMRERPRDRDENGGIPDFFYANPKLRQELAWTFQNLGDTKEELSVEPIVEYYPKAKAAFFDVRGEWQCLLLGGLHAEHAKVEIFGPAVPPLLSRPDVQRVFGDFKIVILNPAESLRTLDGDYVPIRRKTVENCKNADRSEKDTQKRVASIDGAGASEVSSWLAMFNLGGIEYSNWEFPEYVYKEDRTAKLIDAKKVLLARYPGLESYFLSDDDIVKQGGNDA